MRSKLLKGVTKQVVTDTLSMAWPSVLEFVFLQLISMIDSVMVAGLGKAAVAAIGLTNQAMFIRLIPCTAGNIALAAMVARRRGENNREAANRILITGIAFQLVVGAVISILFFVFADGIVRFCGSNADTHEYGVTYLRTFALATCLTVIQTGICAAQRGAGKTKISLLVHIVSSLVNVTFNYLLIEGRFGFPRLEIFGAALASVIGIFTSSVVGVLTLFGKDHFLSLSFIIKNRIKPAFSTLKRILRLMVGSLIEQSLTRAGFLLAVMMIARLGTDELAAHQAVMNVAGLVTATANGLQGALVALIGRAFGQHDFEKAGGHIKVTRIIGIIFSVLVSLVFIFLGRNILSIYFKDAVKDAAVIEIGMKLMYLAAILVFFMMQSVIGMGCLHGAGDTMFSALVGVTCVLVIRNVIGYVCGIVLDWPFTGIMGVWFGLIADHFSRTVITTVRMRGKKWIKLNI
ncbi:MAG: MATE family efflux transporter [Lachnospiraceae bacterium]|nr:MATE family efflux transporter [Lachnospiraceae bacterium]